MKSIDAVVGHNLARLRLLRGLSQAELGRAAGISRSQISKFETGAVYLYAGSLYRLAMALEVPIISFYDGLPLPNSPEDSDIEIDQGLSFPSGKRKTTDTKTDQKNSSYLTRHVFRLFLTERKVYFVRRVAYGDIVRDARKGRQAERFPALLVGWGCSGESRFP